MMEKKRQRPRFGLPKKTFWHLYSLQALNSNKLVKVVEKVLKQEYFLIK
ncbi:MAG: hypothetical protein U9N55_00665 [candidate division Zixibacteria bacterium]|nr:hypothetical protein [candidate division Zixibacteria bacterium]